MQICCCALCNNTTKWSRRPPLCTTADHDEALPPPAAACCFGKEGCSKEVKCESPHHLPPLFFVSLVRDCCVCASARQDIFFTFLSYFFSVSDGTRSPFDTPNATSTILRSPFHRFSSKTALEIQAVDNGWIKVVKRDLIWEQGLFRHARSPHPFFRRCRAIGITHKPNEGANRHQQKQLATTRRHTMCYIVPVCASVCAVLSLVVHKHSWG